MKSIYCIAIVFLICSVSGFAQNYSERFFSEIAAQELKGVCEVSLVGGKRVDIITKDYAIEVEFCFKWYESIGQSLFYSIMTGKRPCVVCICRSSKDYKEFNNLQLVCQVHKISLYRMDYYSRQLKPILLY
jgi:hypothetical protein